MNRIISLVIIFTVLAFASCKNTQQKNNENTTDTTNVAVAENTTQSLSDTKGNELILNYNAEKEEMQITFNNEVFVLKQEPSGSGTRYANSDYELTQWQGMTELLKNGKSMFSNYDNNGEGIENWFKTSDNLSMKVIYATKNDKQIGLISFDFNPLEILDQKEAWAKGADYENENMKWSVNGDKGKLTYKGKTYNFVEEVLK